PNRRAILCVLASSASFAIAAGLVKAVSPTVPVIEIMLFRSLFALVAMLPLAHRAGGWAALRTRHPVGHVLRTLAGFAGMFGSFYGYAHLPLAMVTALGFAMPVFLSILSIPLLGEPVKAGRLVSVGAGLVGVLTVLRPWRAEGAIEIGPALVVVAGVVAWAAAMVSIRRMGQAGERNITIVLWFAVATTAISAVASLPVWVTPSPAVWLALVGIGVISGAAQWLMTEGYRSGEATMLAPFEYGAIIYTVLLGWLVWGEVPGPWETTGILFLVAAGLVTWWRESTQRLPTAVPARP
ncbi:MAG: DMT family transporter, partial [Acetobacteraceae bacterium]|nr:DMT family transporter [Acetobacteraceae bacterium]